MSATILIVDDSPDVRQILAKFLQANSCLQVVGEAASGLEAIKMAEELRPDIILLDLKMPGLNGVEAASVLKRILPKTRILALSAYAESVSPISGASRSDIDLVMQKGSLMDLAYALRTLIPARPPVPEAPSIPSIDRPLIPNPIKPTV